MKTTDKTKRDQLVQTSDILKLSQLAVLIKGCFNLVIHDFKTPQT